MGDVAHDVAHDVACGVAHGIAGIAPRVLKRTAQTALVWTLYEELVPRLLAIALHVGLSPPAVATPRP